MLGINLLPPAEKKKIELANLYRLVYALVLRIGLLLAFGALLLANAWLCLFILLRDQNRLIHLREHDIRLQYIVEMEETTSADNAILEAIAAKQAAAVLWTPILEELSEITPARVSLVKMAYQKATGRLLIAGRAASRDDLLAFEGALKRSSYFTAVDAPLTNLIKQYDVEFSFNLTPTTVGALYPDS